MSKSIKYFAKNEKINAKQFRDNLISNTMRDAAKQASLMLASSYEERDTILREHGRTLCNEYLTKNTIIQEKSRHIPFSFGEVRFVIELFNLTGIEREDGYDKLLPEDRARFDKNTINIGESVYFFVIKPDSRRNK